MKFDSAVFICKRCFTPSTRPRVVFCDGVCNACINADEKRSIDWDYRRREFEKLIQPLRHRAEKGLYSCVVPWSGGKDSSTVAHKLKFDYGLNPLLVTFSPLIPNEIGHQNRESLLNEGFDSILVRPNQKVARYLARRFFIERGNPKVAWDAGINSIPLQIALAQGIPAVFYAEHGESEYGGKVLSEDHKKTRDLTEVIENQVGDFPENWVDGTVTEADLLPYIYPSQGTLIEQSITAYYFSYYHKWSMYENFKYIQNKIQFTTELSGRTTGTFTNFDSLDDKIDDLYYYMQFIKFGFGRCVRDASRMVQNGHISREAGWEHVASYDGEFCEKYLDEVLSYLSLNQSEFIEIVDSHRNPEIWTREGNEWKVHFSKRFY